MSLILKIEGTDRSNQVAWKSFKKVEVLSKEPDILEFEIRNYDTKTFRPALNEEVIVELDALRIFGGNIVETRDVINGKLKFFRIKVKDFTFTLDRTLVKRRFQSTTADSIIATILSDFVEAGFTDTNVNAPTPVEDIIFNHYFVSDALQKLADYIGYEWYVDYFKDIHFFLENETVSPFGLDENSGNFDWNSLIINENIHQLRNKIIVRGGTIVGAERTKPYVGDATQDIFQVGDRHVDMTVKINGSIKTLGKEGIDDDDGSIAVLYNPNSGYIRIKTAPGSGDTIEIISKPAFPLIKVFKDNGSIATFGEFEFVIIDKQIKSSGAAASRAKGELLKWADEIREGVFTTKKDGLRTGQKLTVNIPSRSINRDFVINRITTRAETATGDMRYEVTLLASEQNSMIDILSDLLINRPLTELDIQEDEIVDLVEGAFENINIQELLQIQAEEDVDETITIGEALATSTFVPPFVWAGAGQTLPSKLRWNLGSWG